MINMDIKYLQYFVTKYISIAFPLGAVRIIILKDINCTELNRNLFFYFVMLIIFLNLDICKVHNYSVLALYYLHFISEFVFILSLNVLSKCQHPNERLYQFVVILTDLLNLVVTHYYVTYKCNQEVPLGDVEVVLTPETKNIDFQQFIEKADEVTEDCLICMTDEDKDNGYAIKVCPCPSVYHKTCILKWLEEKKTCPTCRVDITEFVL